MIFWRLSCTMDGEGPRPADTVELDFVLSQSRRRAFLMIKGVRIKQLFHS